MPAALSRTEIAQVAVPRGAARAASTRRYEPEHHMVAWGKREHARTDFHHDTGTLVPADARRIRRGTGEVASDQVLVAVAHPAGSQLDQHLTGLGRIELDLLDAPRRVAFPEDRGFGLHSRTPSVVRLCGRP